MVPMVTNRGFGVDRCSNKYEILEAPMSRIPTASRESVPQDQVDAFDTLVASRGSVPDIGPVAIMINSPELATRGEHFRAYFRGDEITLEVPVENWL